MSRESENNEPVVWTIGGKSLTLSKYEGSPPRDVGVEEGSSKIGRRCSKLLNAVPLPDLLRFLALAILVSLIWGGAYSVLGEIAGPDGQLFKIGFLGVTAYVAGHVTFMLKLPALLGMMLMGLLLRNVNFVVFSGPYLQVTSAIREMAISVIITRAGLELDPAALKKVGIMVAKLFVIPAVIECVFIVVMTYFLLDLPWMWGVLLGSFLPAVSPAVILSSLFQIQKSGKYGTSKGIPTLIIAVTSIDDILCITVFGVILSIIFSTGSLTSQLITGPAGAVIGVLCGMILGVVLRFIPHEKDGRVAMLRTLLLLVTGLVFMFGSTAIGFGSAGPLGCIVCAYMAGNSWDSTGKIIVSENFHLLWSIFEPFLFGLIGNEIDISVLRGNVVGMGVASLVVALVARTACAALVVSGGDYNWKERLFISLALLPKDTVQAALAPVALDRARTLNEQEDIEYANILLIVGVLSIIITAPLGSIIITTLGPKLLKKEDDNTQPA